MLLPLLLRVGGRKAGGEGRCLQQSHTCSQGPEESAQQTASPAWPLCVCCPFLPDAVLITAATAPRQKRERLRLWPMNIWQIPINSNLKWRTLHQSGNQWKHWHQEEVHTLQTKLPWTVTISTDIDVTYFFFWLDSKRYLKQCMGDLGGVDVCCTCSIVLEQIHNSS